jgi:hypothetical protein
VIKTDPRTRGDYTKVSVDTLVLHRQRSGRGAYLRLIVSSASFGCDCEHGSWRSRAPGLDLESWSLELLRALEWKRFELVCAAYFEAIGMRTKVAREGADGGVDIKVYKENDASPSAIAQCKAWKGRPKME